MGRIPMFIPKRKRRRRRRRRRRESSTPVYTHNLSTA
jgi:hypothetical protein